MAEEQGDKNTEISDSDKKMDALMDMIKDACVKMDGVGSRMDAMEENLRRTDARMDAMRKDEDEKKEEEPKADARKDEDEKKEEEPKADARKDAKRKDEDESEEKGEPKEPVADKRKDAAEEEAHADSVYMTKAEAAALRTELADLQARAPAILSNADRERFAIIQEAADPVFQAFNDRAPAPMQGETPTAYKRRLGARMQEHSPKWKDARLSAISDEVILDNVLTEVYADSLAAARKGTDVPAGQLRAHQRTVGGHTIIEYDGGPEAWMNPFAGHRLKATGDWNRPH